MHQNTLPFNEKPTKAKQNSENTHEQRVCLRGLNSGPFVVLQHRVRGSQRKRQVDFYIHTYIHI